MSQPAAESQQAAGRPSQASRQSSQPVHTSCAGVLVLCSHVKQILLKREPDVDGIAYLKPISNRVKIVDGIWGWIASSICSKKSVGDAHAMWAPSTIATSSAISNADGLRKCRHLAMAYRQTIVATIFG